MIWTALLLGFAGSLHCLGMCSPLAMAVTSFSAKQWLSRMLYNAGRILTYSLLGSTVASVGLILPMARFQVLVSLTLGIALAIMGLLKISSITPPFLTPVLVKFNHLLKNLFADALRKRNYGTTFFLGSLNGFLPCGLSFLALTYCLTLAGPLEGLNFMMIFGLGTLPVMMGFTSLFQWIVNRFHVRSQRLSTALLVVSGALLIGRVFFVHLPHVQTAHQGVVDIVICR